MSYRPPAGACDAHVHVFGPYAKFPMAGTRKTVPNEASVDDYMAVQKQLGIERAVVVQSSHFGLDNSCVLDAVARMGTKNAKAIVVVEPATLTDREIARLHALGVNGIRISGIVEIGPNITDLEDVAGRIKGTGWHIELVPPDSIEPMIALRSRIEKLPVPVLFDQMGCPPLAQGVESPAFQEILAMLRDGLFWMKFSHPDRLSPYPYAEILPFARALASANPKRCVFGLAWPHSSAQVRGFVPDDQFLLDLFAQWVPDEATRHAILVDNPAELYGF